MSDDTRQRLRDLEALLQTHPDGLKTADLAAMLGVSQRTVYNDLNRLEMDGVPIIEDHGAYSLDTAYRTTIRLSLAQAWFMYLPLRRIVRAELHRMPLVKSLLHRIASLFHEEIADQLFPLVMDDKPDDRDHIFVDLVRCWQEQRHIECRYRRPNADYDSTLVVAPWWFEPAVWSDAFYLIGGLRRPNGSEDPITLKLDRIHAVTPLQTHFERPSGKAITDYLEHTWGIWVGDGEPVRVKLRFDNRQHQRLQETRWHPTQESWVEPDGSIIWQARISEPQEMLPWIRGWGADVEVLEPDDLRQRIAADADATARLYGNNSTTNDYIF
ncbi:MAG TPA: transcriptional regulator [Aggregatilinea sp.]|uniref:helix-turn-helix transcriptional regulator n=1 Tax=Aggregatilinea sp. TaxID=2806333 RepID=UPI002BAE5435|nr:transcriptional regulator [Aggregatilinea sp.]HML23001.1 transcriptional regulator [Aggregatilinea sp.]